MDPAPSNVSFLQSEDSAKLLDGIDSLRSHGISRFVSLPQIIVVGDQSSGKSSVLEAITGVAFPTSDGLCTRFATEVILRRSKDEKASVRIRPSADCDQERREKLKGFHQAHIALAQVSGLIADATKVMGIAGHTHFSKDVLELEISGPEQPHLTLVDLPGIFHSTTSRQSEDDPALVTNIVRSYMEEQRSIILAVISGKYDYAVQQILGMLKSVDPDGYRTIGVITKPDAIERDSADEQTFLSLARNLERPLKLGWHVLRNPSFTERRDTGFNRDSTEAQFFANQAPWNTLSSRNFGVVALRLRLSRLLFDHITSELPALVDSIELEMAECKSILDTLGTKRSSSEEQRVYLTNIGERFRYLAVDGVEGHYQDSYFTLAADQRLRAKVQKAHAEFATRMANEGHRWKIVPKVDLFSGTSGTPGLILPPEGPATTIERSAYIKKVCDLLEEDRGRELPGNYNPLLVRKLFERQSASWERLAYHHARDILDMVRVFVEDLIEHVAGKERADILLNHLIDPAIAKMQEHLEAKVAELLTPYTKGYPMTLNPDFIATFTKANEEDKARASKLDERKKAELFACSRLVDCMECYYKIALGVFVDNVAMLAIENCILKSVDSLVSAGTIAKLSEEELKLLASESPDAARTRQETLAKQKVLQDGLDICQKHVRRRLGPTRPSKSSSKTGSIATAGAVYLFESSPSRPVIPASLAPSPTTARSGSTSGSLSEPGLQGIQHSPTHPHSSTRTPSITNSPGASLFPARSTESASSLGSSPALGNERSKEFENKVEEL
jgi:GTP-binding protein EngB required for normal cell division